MQNEQSVSRHTIRNILTPDFVVGFFALFVVLMVFSALFPILPIFLAQLGSSEREIGVLVGILGASSLVFRFLVGGVLKRYSEKSVMMSGALLFALTLLACSILRPFWPFFTVRVFQGVAIAGLDTAAFTLLINTVPPASRGQAISYLLLAGPLSLAVAPPFAMLLIDHYGFAVFFLTCAGLSFCSLLLSWKLKGQVIATPDKEPSDHSALFFERKIIVPAAISFLQSFVWGALVTFIPLYTIQCGIKNPGLFFSATAITMIAGRGLGGNIVDTYSKEKIIPTFICTGIITMVILSFSRTLPMFIAVGLLWGIGHAFFVPASMAYALDYAGSSGGTAVGTFRALSDFGQTLGPMVMGIIIHLTGYRIMFLSLAFICLINLIYFQFYVRRRKSDVVSGVREIL